MTPCAGTSWPRCTVALPASKAKRVFKVLDHSSIFLLIAGSYTAFSLLLLEGTTRWVLLGTVWGGAILMMLGGLIVATDPRFRRSAVAATVQALLADSGVAAIVANRVYPAPNGASLRRKPRIWPMKWTP